MNKEKIIRKIGKTERTYSIDVATRKHMVFTLVIESKFCLYSRNDLFLTAIYEWKQMHPFLSCYVKEINNEYYYAFSNSYFLCNSSHNIDFLRYKANKENQQFSSLLNLLIEKELNVPINCSSGNLMWRLRLFQIESAYQHKNYSFKYAVLFSINHSICDGISGYNSLLHLFNIVESLHLRNYKRAVPYEVCLPLEDYLLNEIQDDYFSGLHTSPPAFCNITDTKESGLKLKQIFPNETLSETVICVNKKNRIYATLNDLVDTSRINTSKFRTFSIENDIYKRLVERCHKENVKLNSCLNIVFALAMKSIYKLELNQNEEKIVYFNGVSLRNDLEMNTNHDFRSISYLANKFMNSLSSIDDKKFWHLAVENSTNIHSRLKENKFKKSSQASFCHFFLSNYGKLKSTTNKNLIEVRDLIVNQFIHKNNYSYICFIFAGTVNDQIRFTVRFNSFFVSSNIIDKFIQKSKEIFLNILS